MVDCDFFLAASEFATDRSRRSDVHGGALTRIVVVLVVGWSSACMGNLAYIMIDFSCHVHVMSCSL
jgi:hypothetical protein